MDGIGGKMMGIGCFAGQQTLSRVWGRLVEAYSLGDWREAVSREDGESEGCAALRKLFSGDPGMAGPDGNGPVGEKITGFFLAFENRRLNLSVFTHRQGFRCRKYTASLGKLTDLRRRAHH